MKLIIFILTASALILCGYNAVAEYTSVDAGRSGEFSFLPDARFSLAPVFTQNGESYSTLSRYLSIDAFRYGTFIVSFSTYEDLEYGRGTDPLALNSIYYNMEYINIRDETDYGIWSFFIDHRCMNYVNINAPDEYQMRWYGYGVRWQSLGMMIGEKDRGHGLSLFHSGDYINLSMAARKRIYSEYYPYNYTIDFSLRFDYYFTPGIIPYLSGGGEFFLPDKSDVNMNAESGVRFTGLNCDIIPFLQYSHRSDISSPFTSEKNFLFAGIKFEEALAESHDTAPGLKPKSADVTLAPELHLQGSYSKYISDEYRNYRSDILFTLDLIRIRGSYIFWNSSLVHSSPAVNGGLYPKYIDYYNEAGLSVPLKHGFSVEPFYRYAGYGEGNDVEAGAFTYHTAGLRLQTEGMKPGKVNSGVTGLFNEGFTLLLNTEGRITAGLVPGNGSPDNAWIFEGAIREDILSYRSAVPYLSINYDIEKGIMPGRKSVISEFIPEAGIRVNRDLVFMLFYQYIWRSSDDTDYNISRDYHLAGVRIDL